MSEKVVLPKFDIPVGERAPRRQGGRDRRCPAAGLDADSRRRDWRRHDGAAARPSASATRSSPRGSPRRTRRSRRPRRGSAEAAAKEAAAKADAAAKIEAPRTVAAKATADGAPSGGGRCLASPSATTTARRAPRARARAGRGRQGLGRRQEVGAPRSTGTTPRSTSFWRSSSRLSARARRPGAR